MRPAIRSLLLFILGWLPVCVGLFLFLASFFTSWDGRAVSVRSSDPEQAVYSVLIAPDEGERFEVDWPVIAVEGLNLSIDPLALPPKPLPDGLPRTKKQPWTMEFTVSPDGGGVRTVPTTGPQAISIALLVFLLGIGIRNMLVAGSPISIEPRGITLPKGQAAAGQIAPTSGGTGGSGGRSSRTSRPRKGPPPGKRRRGGGRRK